MSTDSKTVLVLTGKRIDEVRSTLSLRNSNGLVTDTEIVNYLVEQMKKEIDEYVVKYLKERNC